MPEFATGGIIRGPIEWPRDEGTDYIIPINAEQRDRALEMLRRLAKADDDER